MSIKKLLAGAGAVALLAAGAVVGAGPAQAAPSLTITPNSNLKGGQVVTVTYQGFSPNAPVALGVCPTGRDVKGPGDCGRSKNGNSKLTTADASGKGTAQITIPEGALGNATPPAAKCPPCSMGATNIANGTERVTVELEYASTSKPLEDPAPTPKPGGDDNQGGLPQTGPRETLITALLGFALLQIGLVLAVRNRRPASRRAAL